MLKAPGPGAGEHTAELERAAGPRPPVPSPKTAVPTPITVALLAGDPAPSSHGLWKLVAEAAGKGRGTARPPRRRPRIRQVSATAMRVPPGQLPLCSKRHLHETSRKI